MHFRFSALAASVFLASGWCGTTFTMDPWILVFEPQKKVISQVVNFKYHSETSGPEEKIQGPSPNDDRNAPKPIEITISERELTLDGTVTYPSSKGADDFVVYPSQFILYPGDTKKVQVQWVGAKPPAKETSFGFIATQLPLNLEEKAEKPKTPVAKVEVLTRYEGIIVVRPENIRPMVVVDTAYPHRDSTGNHLVVVLNNKGTALQSLKNIDFAISPLDQNGKIKFNERILSKNKMTSAATNQSLFAGYKRKVEIPWPAGFPVAPVNVTATFPEGPK
jgi:P pilus assembly chaperone PapD